MAAGVFALITLCLAFSVYGIPVTVDISPPEPQANENQEAFQGTNPQLLGGGMEGDMIFPKGVNPKSSTRGVAIYGNMKWPNNVIPYDISAITNANDQKTITDAMNTLMFDVGTPKPNAADRTACVYFRPRQSTDKNFFKIQYGNGCSAHVGHVTGIQPTMTLQQNGCFYSKTIQHELMHVIGFFHEQSRPDRDDFLQISLENVEANMVHNFNRYAWGTSVLNQGSTYDYASIMHYDTTAFSMNGKPTMTPRKAGAVIGKATGLSPMDIAEVRHLLGCQA